MVRETVKAYTSRLPPPGGLNRTKKSDAKPEELASEIIELKKALNSARQDLQMEKVKSRRLESCGGRKRAKEDSGAGDSDPKVGEGVPSRAHLTFRQGMDETQINRELLTKMMSLSEIIRNLSEENESLRQENCNVRESSKEASSQEIQEMQGVVMSYQRQAKEMAERIQDLERQVAEAQTEVFTTTEKSKYKQLARRLKEERNTAKEQLAKRTNEQQEVNEEMEKLAFLVKDLRMQCDKLQAEVKDSDSREVEVQVDLDDEEDSGYRSSIPCQSSYCSPAKETVDASVQWEEEENREELLVSPASSSLSPDFRLATPAGLLGPTPRLVDSGLLVQEEQERQEAIEELQATFMGHQARQPVVRALQVKEGKLKEKGSSWSTMIMTTMMTMTMISLSLTMMITMPGGKRD